MPQRIDGNHDLVKARPPAKRKFGQAHWAHQVRGRFPHGQLYVNLRGFDPSGQVMHPAEAVRRFLDALDVPPERIPADLDAQAALYRSQLSGRRMLIVLDNARDTTQVRPLLPGTPSCLVLVTSRNQLTSRCQQSLVLLQELGDRYGQAGTWDSVGYVHHHLGQYAQAITCYQHALDLFQEFGDRYYEAVLLCHLGDTHHAAGDLDAARDARRQALAILDDLKHPDADEVRAKLDRLT